MKIYPRNSQKADILTWFETNKVLTHKDSVYELGILNPSARIDEMRNDGYVVNVVYKEGISKRGRRFRFAEYSLENSKLQS